MTNLILTLIQNREHHLNIYLQAAILYTLAIIFYLYTLQPSLAWGDGTKLQLETIRGESFILSELPEDLFADDQFPFAKLGVAAWDHPLYVIFGHTLVQIFPNIHTPWLINSISAFFGAAAIVVLFLLIHTHTQTLSTSLLAAFSVAVSHTFWFHSVTPEVYTLFAFLLLLSIYLFDRFERLGTFPSLFFSVFLLGLGASNHLLTFLIFPAFLIYRLLSKGTLSRETLDPLKLVLLGLAFVAGFSPYLIQFFRMVRVFPISEVFGPVIGSVFLQEVLSTTPRLLLNSLAGYLMLLAYQFNPVSLLIGIIGFLHGMRVSGALWRKVVAFYLVYTAFGIFYRVTDQFAFLLTSHLFFGISFALGLAYLISKLSYTKSRRLIAGLSLMILIMPLFYGLVPTIAKHVGLNDDTLGIPQIGTDIRNGVSYYANPNKRAESAAYMFGRDFFARAPENSLVIAEFYTDTDEYFILQYFSKVEAQRPDLEIEGWPTDNPFYFNPEVVVRLVADQVERRPVYLASLSEEFYDAATLTEKYCIVQELNLYRIYPRDSISPDSEDLSCEASSS